MTNKDSICCCERLERLSRILLLNSDLGLFSSVSIDRQFSLTGVGRREPELTFLCTTFETQMGNRLLRVPSRFIRVKLWNACKIIREDFLVEDHDELLIWYMHTKRRHRLFQNFKKNLLEDFYRPPNGLMVRKHMREALQLIEGSVDVSSHEMEPVEEIDKNVDYYIGSW